ncbi:hypothetical protein GXN76_15785 [Kroppenstedtia pulmonis]|uniref:Uncharacterized protein n=1 Tax=Kroppenstedtia pulmonis TaxID=1380685 RepID=A0A7D3XPV6_9BACL|nr:hypothetical protein [Kroppenstedtia pulmonis]QKG85769.1 hypothetical protein GXN76_15785 [Kroppenstedtia pulmonis]
MVKKIIVSFFAVSVTFLGFADGDWAFANDLSQINPTDIEITERYEPNFDELFKNADELQNISSPYSD